MSSEEFVRGMNREAAKNDAAREIGMRSGDKEAPPMQEYLESVADATELQSRLTRWVEGLSTDSEYDLNTRRQIAEHGMRAILWVLKVGTKPSENVSDPAIYAIQNLSYVARAYGFEIVPINKDQPNRSSGMLSGK